MRIDWVILGLAFCLMLTGIAIMNLAGLNGQFISGWAVGWFSCTSGWWMKTKREIDRRNSTP